MMMRYFLLLLCLLPPLLYAQECPNPQKYQEKILAADSCIQAGNFSLAYDNYSAAQIYCRDSAGVVEEAKADLFRKINVLREEAESAKQEAEEAKEAAVAARAETEVALDKTNKLVNAFYFYADRFALAFKQGKFYFIDKNGDEVEKLGRWEKAEQFDDRGLAKVVGKDNLNYLLDTAGQSYHVAYRLENLGSSTTALDLRGLQLDSFPTSILQHPQLEVLLLDGNYGSQKHFSVLTPHIENFSSLQILSLANCHIQSIPPEIGQLSNLTSLDLSRNELTSLPPEIGQLSNLKKLNLGGSSINLGPGRGLLNQITDLTSEIGSLTNLTELDLSGNLLVRLPPEIGQLNNLNKLDLSHNHLTSLPLGIGKLKNLTELDLSFNKIRELPSQFGNLQNLTIFNISNNMLTFLPTEFWDLTKLKKLYLSGNLLNTMEYGAIRQSLPNCMIYFHSLPGGFKLQLNFKHFLENGY